MRRRLWLNATGNATMVSAFTENAQGSIALFAGTTDAATVMQQSGDAKARRRQTCDVDFFIGEWRLLHGCANDARASLEKAKRDCLQTTSNSLAAFAELPRMK
jgi:hypothetical protein